MVDFLGEGQERIHIDSYRRNLMSETLEMAEMLEQNTDAKQSNDTNGQKEVSDGSVQKNKEVTAPVKGSR